VHARACVLENAPNGDFIVDQHPQLQNVWLVGGGSGHGFKFGPVLGDYVLERVNGREGQPGLAALFRLKR
jgi:glycine/D-amino acid oxidase-like deaminating enzyme